jgi:hypothetical protein
MSINMVVEFYTQFYKLLEILKVLSLVYQTGLSSLDRPCLRVAFLALEF